MTRSRGSYADTIANYYSKTELDYRILWMNDSNRALHFGYQSGGGATHAESLTNSNNVLAGMAQIRAGDRVLDAGCGIGGTSLWLAKERSAHVVGIALGTDQIRSATAEAGRRRLSQCARFLVADFTAMPFAAESFDVVWAQESLCHAVDKARFFHEAARVLARGGRIIVSDGMLKRKSISEIDRTLLREWFNGWKLAGLWTAAEHAAAAAAAGFTAVSIRDVTANTLASHRRLYQTARRSLPIAKLLAITGLRDSTQTGNVISALRQYETLRKDCWFYGILVAQKLTV